MIWRLAILLLLPWQAVADTVVPTRPIRANDIITATDVTLRNMPNATGFTAIEDVVGQEARVVLYPGRPIKLDDIGPPAIIARNQVVRMAFVAGGLQIITEGRALERGAIGDRVRIMNLTSRSTIIGEVLSDGSISVSP